VVGHILIFTAMML